jgi:uncharacterized Zn finger protein (UPF0148 family)
MKCIICNEEFEAKRADAKVCSDKCQKRLSRTTKSTKVISDTVGKDMSDIIPLKEINVTLAEVCTLEELRDYPAMCETKRIQKEAIYRLENNSIEDLQARGISIPNWKRTKEEGSKLNESKG